MSQYNVNTLQCHYIIISHFNVIPYNVITLQCRYIIMYQYNVHRLLSHYIIVNIRSYGTQYNVCRNLIIGLTF
jgi:hypothetical protein